MRKRAMLVLAMALVGCGTDAPQRVLGPEWNKVGGDYLRKVEVQGVRYGAGNVSNYTLPLENEQLFAAEVDNGRGFTVGSREAGYLRVDKDDHRRVTAYTVVLGKMDYYDLNGDGVIDAIDDRNADHTTIVFEGRYVHIRRSRGRLGTQPVYAVGGAPKYKFENDRWIVE